MSTPTPVIAAHLGDHEYDKWTVLRNKSDLREINEYRNVFFE